MDVQTILLGFLMHKSMTGYELKKAFAIPFSFFSGLSYGSIYPALNRMEKQGWVSMQLEVQDGTPNRKIYTITDAGREAFLEALKTPLSVDRFKNAFLTRLFFFAHLSPDERHAIANGYLESIEALSQQLEVVRPEVEAHADHFQYLCFKFGLRAFRDLVRNVSETVSALDRGKNN